MTRDEHMNPIEDNAPPGDRAAPAPLEAEQRPRRLVSRRALVRAGWVVPVVLALHLPVNAFAQSSGDPPPPPPSGTHTDVPATTHSDIAAVAHSDNTILGVHADTP